MDSLLAQNFKRHINLDKEEFDIILKSIKQKKVGSNEFLIQSGNVAKNTYFVNKGCLDFTRFKKME